ncbi:NAD+ synthase [Azonexus sp.]|jgi:NAD+ synthase/NAD+ synthase (glutamine-hydrolysing)|uniref:NAD+ synthase n=1 Tax=Azonexus sp. TaxID=1872668 RepID=UPI00281B88A7|nr:NAD+ synthase [Azonexus sp.]MDR1996555.1 NAD+ synthase [Azonexus sp.]
MRIAVAQFNATVGDLTGNVERIVRCAAEARACGAQVLLTPELALCGYPPEDLLLRPDFYRACAQALAELAGRVGDIALVVGHPLEADGLCYNAASVIENGHCTAVYRKNHLANYEVFDERRYFAAGDAPCVVTLGGVRCGINICADVWEEGAFEAAADVGAELMLVLNASPCHLGKQNDRRQALGERVAACGIAAIYCNLIGGQDELVFDGASFALDAGQIVRMRLPQFEEALGIVDFRAGELHSADLAAELPLEAEAYRALVLGVRDYVGKNGFPGAIVGFSGGIDSALTLCVAVDALGADKVRAVMMPSPYTARMSLDDSREMVRRLAVRYDEIAIAPAMQTYAVLLEPLFADLPADTTEENIQARIRGNLLMALSNKTGALVLTTGNKSEMAVGYCTLYGDMAGGFAVLKDVYKTLVYRLADYRNGISSVIPDNIISRPPSAELKPDQVDQDSLPPYEVLDTIVRAYMEEDRSPREVIAAGLPEEAVRRVVRLLRVAEYKRRQAPVGIRITPRGFGKDWRYPITNRYRDEF